MAKVLVVDDDRVIQQLLVVNLELEGFDIETASDGEEAVQKILSNKYDLVLLDIMMPKLDGREVCRRVKADPRGKDVPIIFLSARAQDLDVRQGYDLGVAAYVTKPFDPVDLIDVVSRVLNGERVLPPRS
ncbi:MAG: response regulator transcription factor [Actinomycetota bacterium]|nr:response regulator [Actinomycetota bacterium]